MQQQFEPTGADAAAHSELASDGVALAAARESPGGAFCVGDSLNLSRAASSSAAFLGGCGDLRFLDGCGDESFLDGCGALRFLDGRLAETRASSTGVETCASSIGVEWRREVPRRVWRRALPRRARQRIHCHIALLAGPGCRRSRSTRSCAATWRPACRATKSGFMTNGSGRWPASRSPAGGSSWATCGGRARRPRLLVGNLVA